MAGDEEDDSVCRSLEKAKTEWKCIDPSQGGKQEQVDGFMLPGRKHSPGVCWTFFSVFFTFSYFWSHQPQSCQDVVHVCGSPMGADSGGD